MWDVKACIACFSTKRKLCKISHGILKEYYFSVTGIRPEDTMGMPQYLCMECSGHVRSFRKFQDRCKRAHFALKELLKRDKEVKLIMLEAIDRKLIDIAPKLSYVSENRTHYEEAKFQWTKTNRLSIPVKQSFFIQHYSTFTVDNFEPEIKKPRLCFDGEEIKIETDDGKQLEIQFNHIDENDSINATSNIKTKDLYFDDDNDFNDDQDSKYFEVDPSVASEMLDQQTPTVSKAQLPGQGVDGSGLDEEYATIVPLTSCEAKAVVDIYKQMTYGKYKCHVCDRNFGHEETLNTHLRMHDQFASGPFLCMLCQYYYKTDYLLKTHISDKHLYKYLCRSCNEVTYDRVSAKQHYIWTHLQKTHNGDTTWKGSRSKLNRRKYKNINKGSNLATMSSVKKKINIKDLLKYTPVSQEDQYALVLDRKKSRNYLEAQFKCEYCFRGFRETATFENHMKKHNPEVSGKYQCDMCKLYFRDTRKMYKHMQMLHLFKWTCLRCNFTIYNRGQALSHYKEHKNITYKCDFCDLTFKKASTRLTHIRIKHPSTFVCAICGHSFVSEMGLHCHMKLSHTPQEMKLASKEVGDCSDSNYCADCGLLFLSDAAYKTHLGSSSRHATTNLAIQRSACKPRRGKPKASRSRKAGTASSDIVNNGLPTATCCEVCGKFLTNDVQARKHYELEHPGTDYLKRYMCDVCGHTTRQHANLVIHMRTHTLEKPYPCPHCDRRFSMSSNRDRHIVVHTGEKPYQCQHCSRRFSQSAAVKLHIQTVHLKIPYAPWSKANRKRRRKEIAGPVPALQPPLPPPPPALPAAKLMLHSITDTQGDYLNAYITYNDE